jgi:hypothetical protein
MAVLSDPVSKPRRTLHVSAVLGGGGALPEVEAGIRKLAGIVRLEEEARSADDPAREATVDVTFHVPGTILRPNYEGMRTGRWVKDKRLLVVQIAVPESLSGSSRINHFLADSLRRAVALAADWMKKKKLELSLERAREIADSAASVLEN